MKRIFCLLSTLAILLFLGFKAFALNSSYKFVWSNTYVDIPLYDDLDSYKYTPTVKLYIDGELKDDAVITISTEGDWLYLLEDVDVNKIGEYKVWYKASEKKYNPGTCNGYKCLVTFNVKDSKKPEIFKLEDNISFPQGTKITSDLLKSYFKFTDNYSKEIGCQFNGIDFDSSIVGIYNASVTATDESNNFNTMNFNINIYNKEAPKITFLGVNDKLKIQLDEDIDIRSYFKVTDDYDTDILNRTTFPVIDTSKLGVINYTVTAVDSSGTSTSYTITIEIVDDLAPTIELYQYEKTENYLAADTIDYMSYVKSLSDNNELLDTSLVRYTTNVVSKVGKYYVNYEYVDDGGNKATAILTINLVSYKAPKIIIDDTKTTFKQGQYIDIDQIVEVYDDSDPLAYQSLSITGTTDFNEIGTYTLEAYAINSSGVSTTKTFYIYIVEDNPVLGIFKSDNWVYLCIAGFFGIAIGFGVYYILKFKKKNLE